MREQIEFTERPPDSVREALREWLIHHGIDPRGVPVSWLDRCEETRRIRYPEVVFGVDPDPRPGSVWLRTINEVVRTVQLEAAPSPFPPLTGARFNYAGIRNLDYAATLTVPPTWPRTGGDFTVRLGDPELELRLRPGAARIVHDS